uniref:Uncharacterized protein n=1 Tax=Arundo donax TaxID=35708 RepID=A0A0A9C842_ARUDO
MQLSLELTVWWVPGIHTNIFLTPDSLTLPHPLTSHPHHTFSIPVMHADMGPPLKQGAGNQNNQCTGK